LTGVAMPSASRRAQHVAVDVVDFAALPRATSCAWTISASPSTRDAGHGGADVARHRDAVGLRHGEAFGDDVLHHAGDAFTPRDGAVGQLGDGGEAVVGAVDDQLGPQRAGDIVGDRHRHAGEGELGDHLGAAVKGADHQLAAPVVAQVAGPGHLGGDIHHGGMHRPPQRRLQAFGVVVAVLQAQHDDIGRKVRRHFRGGLQGIGRLHAAQHHVGAVDAAGVGACGDLDVLLEGLRFHVEAVALIASTCARPADQHHLAAGPRQHAAVVAADGAGTEYRGFHVHHPP
jgi:hypothetical protein